MSLIHRVMAIPVIFLLIGFVCTKVDAANIVPGKVITTVSALDLSHPPTTDAIMAAGQLGGALYPTHEWGEGSDVDAMNLLFGRAIELWNRHEYRQSAQLLKQYVKRYPDSPWVSDSLLHLGCDAQYNGRYSEAQRYFEQIIKDNQGKSHPGAVALTDKAKLRLGVLKVYQNNLEEAQNLFQGLNKNAYDWRERTYSSHWLHRIGRMKKQGGGGTELR